MEKVKCSNCGVINQAGSTKCVKCRAPLPRVHVESVASPGPKEEKDPYAEFRYQNGQEVARRYTVRRQIGRGGMGIIYRVYDNVLKEEVVLKTLLPQFAEDKLVVSRFFNEARIARQLSHPNIVRVHDIGMAKGGIYISMEYLKGKSLRDILDEMPAGGRLPIKTTMHIFDELCSALEYAHHYTIHRDIKPDNVMIMPDGHTKLMDFGISKLRDNSLLTETSVVMGTPFYMSPEQLRNSKDVDGRADIYSLGVMLYEILTGNIPTGIPKPASQLIREVPPALDPIVAKCVEPNLNKRYQNVNELKDAIGEILRLLETDEKPQKPDLTPDILKKPEVEKPRVLRRVVGIFLVLAILAAAGLGIWKLGQRKGTDTITETGHRNGKPVIEKDSFSALSKYVELHMLQSTNNAAKFDDREIEVKNTADALWIRAQLAEGQGDPRSKRLAIETLQCLIALDIWYEGMCFVPPGDVEMPTGEIKHLDGFFIDETEVTCGQFQTFCSSANWTMSRELREADPLLPVVFTSFHDAQAYASWAGKKLPTEVQWARAAYGDQWSLRRYPWGDENLPGACNSLETAEGGEGYSAIVGSFPEDVSPFGCLDMVGNVMEWTRTPFQSDATGTSHITRGGSFNLQQIPLFNNQGHWISETTMDDLGFRCVIELPSTKEGIDALLSL